MREDEEESGWTGHWVRSNSYSVNHSLLVCAINGIIILCHTETMRDLWKRLPLAPAHSFRCSRILVGIHPLTRHPVSVCCAHDMDRSTVAALVAGRW